MSLQLGLDPHEERHDRHGGMALLAAILSIATHLVLMVVVADWRLDRASLPERRDARDPARPPTHIERVTRDPARASDRLSAGDASAGAGAGAGTSGDRLRELSRFPDPALLTPPALTRDALAGTLVNLQAPTRHPTAFAWQPRQQILAVLDRQVPDDVALLPRREIAAIERVPRAPDYVPPVDVTRDRFGSAQALLPPTTEGAADRDAAAPAEPETPPEMTLPEEASSVATGHRFGDRDLEGAGSENLDNRLVARMTCFREPGTPGRVFFRVTLSRRDEAVLPVAPKDFLFVQDSSASLAEERLFFCRQALTASLAALQPEDRFSVVKFSAVPTFCFDGWAAVTPANLQTAETFIASMRAEGETDVFTSMRALRMLPRDSRRPLIAVLITDGRSTTGLTASTRIIGDFTRLNDNGLSVFTLGTHGRANAYLLDLLSYCNGGAATIVTSGRWDIPKAITTLVDGLRRPVLGDVSATVDLASRADLYPRRIGNLYADRPVDFYGSCPGDTTTLLLHVRGRGGEANCDVLFNLVLSDAAVGDDALRTSWARQRMYSLVGAYARRPDELLLAEMYRLSRAYRLPIPYHKEL